MLSKLSTIALLASTPFASAIPAINHNAVPKRQEEWNLWEVSLYKSGCDDEATESFSGHDDQTFPCAGGSVGWHNVNMKNLEATGHKVVLYSDLGCLDEIGQVTKDGRCYSAPSDVMSLLFTASTLTTTLAQNSSCDTQNEIYINLNSTGQHEFTWDSSYATNDPWYVSVLVKSGAEWTDARDVVATAYVSAPGNVPNDTGICLYQYTNINATLAAGGDNSCNGVISSNCIDFLTDALNEPTYGLKCPEENIGPTSDAFNKACPMLIGNAGYSSYFVDVTNGTCAYTDMPGVHIPDGYNTFRTQIGLDPFETIEVSADANQAYDFMTRQAIPVVMLGRFVNPQSNKVDRSVEIVCLNANNTVEGSRVPEKEAPWESAGTGLSANKVGWVVAGVVAVVLAW
ncbi:hypothetical protein P171DRAFT_363470 [Karstenula rhodostoma CBS 690.94]|uniref:Uncharacterized protein n=1 Tax=Karstenula rhodostoma CBS 690.94 TaxID=1392251 RepID=A0A9P4PH90_9PLEO|nr:hypothetical protein P171DRAFT_363470 [Karstenula rhodostoma CBS 690.94]